MSNESNDKTTPSGAEGHQGKHYLNVSKGFASWALTVDHKRIGLMYLAGIVVSLILGGIYALLLRMELWTPTGYLHGDPETYNQAFTLHGSIMTFLFIIPGIPAVLGNFALPIMLGARDVAFPKLNLFSFYLWCAGCVCLLLVLFTGGLDTGWTFYTPYSVETNTSVILAVLGVFILGFSSILTGLNFITTIHKMRTKGMTWFRLPLFAWALYATALIQVLATPVLGITLLLLIMERVLGIGIFNPAMGGDPVLFQHFFWFYSHPAVYIMILPAMGVVSELISTGARKHVFGYEMIAVSSVAIAILGFLVWGHHMFTSGQSQMASVVFSAITFTIAIPSAIKVFNWMATMYKGQVRLHAPMLYGLSFLFLFAVGGLTGVFLSTLGVDIHLHDTYFVVAHFHFVMVGSVLIAFLGGLHYWWPKMTGKSYNEPLAKLSCFLVFLGFNVTFLPQFVMGTRGMPRRYHNYFVEGEPELTAFFQACHQWSTVGAFILAAGLFLALFYLTASLLFGKKAVQNPWGGSGLEWKVPSPPTHHNFEGAVPDIASVYDYDRIVWDPAQKTFIEVAPTETPEPAEGQPVGSGEGKA